MAGLLSMNGSKKNSVGETKGYLSSEGVVGGGVAGLVLMRILLGNM